MKGGDQEQGGGPEVETRWERALGEKDSGTGPEQGSGLGNVSSLPQIPMNSKFIMKKAKVYRLNHF